MPYWTAQRRVLASIIDEVVARAAAGVRSWVCSWNGARTLHSFGISASCLTLLDDPRIELFGLVGRHRFIGLRGLRLNHSGLLTGLIDVTDFRPSLRGRPRTLSLPLQLPPLLDRRKTACARRPCRRAPSISALAARPSTSFLVITSPPSYGLSQPCGHPSRPAAVPLPRSPQPTPLFLVATDGNESGTRSDTVNVSLTHH